jgi:hypothetical protein
MILYSSIQQVLTVDIAKNHHTPVQIPDGSFGNAIRNRGVALYAGQLWCDRGKLRWKS